MSGRGFSPGLCEKGYITLLHRVKPAYDTLCRQPYAVKLKFFEPSVTTLHQRLLNQVHTESHIGTVQAEGFHEVALLSAAGVVTAAELLAAQQLDSAFCFVGTAGHHAGRNYSWGFCYYNDVAMAVVRLRQLGVNRILILDMDPHSGDGTRDILALDPQITHINFFADEDYSYQDDKHHNYGILIDNATDKVFLEALEEILPKAANVDFVIVIFGHDSHVKTMVTLLNYQRISRIYPPYEGICSEQTFAICLSGGSNPQVAASLSPQHRVLA